MADNSNVTPLRKRGRPKLSEVQRRASNVIKSAEVEAQKVAIGEMVVERMDEIVALLRGAGFKISHQDHHASVTHPALAPQIVNPCKLCGRPGVRADAQGAWLCAPHAAYEGANNAIQPEVASMAQPQVPLRIRAEKPAPPNGAPPPMGRQVIHPEPIDYMKGNIPAGATADGPRVAVLDDPDDGA